MPEPFKNLLGPHVVESAARHLRRAWPEFDTARFRRLALADLEQLEMKARAMQIATALEATLPEPYAKAADTIEAALAPMPGHRYTGTSAASDQGLAGWVIWPVGEYVARRGLAAPKRALQTLHAITQRLTAEWAIRPFLIQHPDLTFATLRRWSTDPNDHVRRLVSEGSRPRLPWGVQLKSLIADPSPTLPLLAVLQDDPSEYVRRSVANHLNDIAKDHPEVVADWVERHLSGTSPERTAVLRHASRTLIKRGHPRVLAAFGAGAAFRGTVSLQLQPQRIALGGEVVLTLELHSSARQTQKLEIDYAVHHIKANGSTSPKVFKGWRLELAAGEERVLSKRHSLKPITTRTYYPGRHRIELMINGACVAEAVFDLTC